MAVMAGNTITTGPYTRSYINHGSVVVGSPRGSGYLNSNYLFGVGYAGAVPLSSRIPSLSDINADYGSVATGCPPCS